MNIISYLYHKTGQLCIQLLSELLSRPIDTKGFERILIIAPHPDDEVFGCSLLIQQLIAVGKKVSIVILSPGEAVHRHCCPHHEEEVIKKRQQIALRSVSLLGVASENVYFLRFPDSALSSVTPSSSLVVELSKLITDIAPDALFYPHPLEYSPDHMAATRLIRGLILDTSIDQYFYCVWVWYHMPLIKIFNMQWSDAYFVKGINEQTKRLAILSYMQDKAPCGVSYSGALPELFIKAHQRNKELYFKAR